MKGKILKKVKLLITIGIVGLFVWFLILYPMITFRQNEKVMADAGKRYFELNSNELPTGNRVKTVSLKTLYYKSFLEKDLFIPYSKNTCSLDNSWVKVKRDNNGEYKYYVFLDCGVLSSNVDHKGPEIKLNGDQEITLGIDEEYKEEGIKSIVDANDGKIDIESATIKGEVDTSKIGTYDIQYIAFDSLSNKTTVTRKVEVVKKLNSTVKKALNGADNYTGNPDNNYIRLSNMMFRLYGIDEDNNILIVSDEDIANVNFTKIDKWLEYYYEHLNEKTKKMIVEKKYCNMTLSDTTLDVTQCNSYTDKKKVYIPSVVEVNKSKAGNTFMKPHTISWVANNKDANNAYVTRDKFYDEEAGKDYISYPTIHNYGVRPMMTIKGDTLIKGGKGTEKDPYVFDDSSTAKGGSLVNERSTGEFISDGTNLWRIIDVSNDGTTKVISVSTIQGINDPKEIAYHYTNMNGKVSYNPKDKESVGYYINNRVSKYVSTSNLVNHEIQVPIYKKEIIYGEEIDTKTYKVVLSAPNMYEMFSSQNVDYSGRSNRSYWLINTSKTAAIAGAIYDLGVPANAGVEPYADFGIRVVGYLKKSTIITNGKGTLEKPYIIK